MTKRVAALPSPLVALLVALLVAILLPAVPATAATAAPVNTVPPSVTGEAVNRGLLEADPGAWESPEGLTFDYQWLRAGTAIPDATRARYRPTVLDVHRRLRVQVTATDAAGQTATAVSEPTPRVRPAAFDVLERPGVSGTMRFTEVVRADPGRWSPKRHRTRFHWFRDGEQIRGATGRRYRLGHRDVGHRIRVRVTVRKAGFRVRRAFSRPTRRIGHLVPVRRTATYRIETRGTITARRKVFRRQVAATLADPRGWRAAGVRFRRVKRGGDFSVVLAEAGTVPGFSPVCSAEWSCRVGRYVVINQKRWLHATPSWNGADKSLRGYRHMVLNHETGHWLGHRHLSCPGEGKPAPVMMQQSKELAGCRHNPWPLPSERWYR